MQTITRYTLFGLLIFAPLARGAVQGWAVTLIHMATWIALTVYLLEKSLNGRWIWIKTPLDKPIVILMFLMGLANLFSVHKYTSFWSSILLLNYVAVYYLIIHTVRTRSQLRQLIYVIIGVATFLAVFGLFKKFGYNPFPWWYYPEITQNVDRLASTFGNANHLAGYMEMSIPLVLGLFLTGLKRGEFLFMVGITFLLFLSLMLSLSRGGWIGMLVGLLFMAAVLRFETNFKKKKLMVALAGGTFVVVLAVLTSTSTVERVLALEEKQGLQARIMVWEGAVEMIKDHLLVGTGPGTFPIIYSQYQPPGLERRYFMAHNDYLQMVSELGIPLILVIIWMVVAFYKNGFRKLYYTSRLVRGTTLGAMAGITAILFHSILDFNLHIPANAILFTTLAAIAVAPIPDR